WILEHFERLCLDRARNLIVINPFVAECYRLNVERYRLFSIPNAIGPHFFSAPPQPRAPATLLTVGAIDRRKAHDVLLRAVARLGRPLRAIFAGPVADPTHHRLLQSLVREQQLDLEFADFIPPDQA